MDRVTRPEGAVSAVRSYRPLQALLPANWERGTLTTNGARHSYYRTGGGKCAVVLLHGFLDGATAWLRTARALENEYDVVCPDARGHGRSDRCGAQFDPDQLAEDAAGIIRALRLGPARIVGHSMGGGTGIRLADRYPDLVRALVVEGWGHADTQAANLAATPGYQAWFGVFVAWLEALKTQSHSERLVSALSLLPPGAPLLPEEEYVPWVDNCAHADLDLVRLGAALWSRGNADLAALTGALGRMTVPVLVLKSDFVPTPGPRRVREAATAWPGVRVVEFEHTGHLIHRDALEEFLGLVREFFQAH